MFFTLLTSCNKILPIVIGAANTERYMNMIITNLLDEEIQKLTIYTDKNNFDGENENNIPDTDNTPYVVSNVSYKHIISYILTQDQSKKIFDALQAYSQAHDSKCHIPTIISIFESEGHKGVDFIQVFKNIEIL